MNRDDGVVVGQIGERITSRCSTAVSTMGVFSEKLRAIFLNKLGPQAPQCSCTISGGRPGVERTADSRQMAAPVPGC